MAHVVVLTMVSGWLAVCRMWSSSLTGSASKGMPDIEKVSTSERLDLVADAFEVTGKPLIYDGVRLRSRVASAAPSRRWGAPATPLTAALGRRTRAVTRRSSTSPCGRWSEWASQPASSRTRPG